MTIDSILMVGWRIFQPDHTVTRHFLGQRLVTRNICNIQLHIQNTHIFVPGNSKSLSCGHCGSISWSFQKKVMDEKRSKATRNCTFRMTNKNWSCQMSCLAIYVPGSRFATTPPPPPIWYGPKTCVLQHSA